MDEKYSADIIYLAPNLPYKKIIQNSLNHENVWLYKYTRHSLPLFKYLFVVPFMSSRNRFYFNQNIFVSKETKFLLITIY